jgi:MFS family permease
VLLKTPGGTRSFLAASFQSSIGNAIAYIALLLVAYDLTRSAWAVGAVLLAEFIPAIALGPLFGALADRYPRRRLVVTADLLRCGAFVALAFAGSLPAVIALALVAGAGGALYQPAAKSALPGLAGEHADRAMGALVASWSAAGMVGPGIGAALLVVLSPADLLLVNAATFLLSAVVLGRLPLDRPAPALAADSAAQATEAPTGAGDGVRAGLRTVRSAPGLAVVVGAGMATTLAFSMMNVAEPLLARQELRTNGAGFALLVCAFGIGSTVGALRGRASGWTMLATLAGGGLALVASALAPSVGVAAATFLVTGIFAGAFMSSEYQLITRLAPEAVLGRVFGLKDSLDALALCAAFVGGALIASHSDARVVFAVGGSAALLAALASTAMLMRAGVVSRPRARAHAPRPQRVALWPAPRWKSARRPAEGRARPARTAGAQRASDRASSTNSRTPQPEPPLAA